MFVEHVALQKIYSILATVNMMHLFTHAFKKITYIRFIMCFPFHKGYYGKPAHHKGASIPIMASN